MKLALLATLNNPHTRRWLEFLTGRPEVELVLLCDRDETDIPGELNVIHPEMNFLTKVIAFKLFPKPFGNNVFKYIPYRKELRVIQPDIIHGMEILPFRENIQDLCYMPTQ